MSRTLSVQRAPVSIRSLVPSLPVSHLTLAIAVGLASFPWFRFELLFLETSVMHFVILGTFVPFVLPGVRTANKVWLTLGALLVLFTAANSIPVAGDPESVWAAIRFTTRLAMCFVTAVAMAGLTASDREFPQRFLRIVSSFVLMIGTGLFVHSFLILGDDFINVSPGFVPGSDIHRNQSGFAFAFAAVASVAAAASKPTVGGFLKAAALLTLTVISGSRGAALAALVGVVVAVVLLARRKRSVLAVVALVIVAVTFRSGVPETIRSRFNDLADGGPAAYSQRDQLATIAFLVAFPDAPIFGHGTGTAMAYLGRSHGLWRGVDAHSDLSLLAIESGMTGIGLYFGSVIAILIVGHRAWARAGPDHRPAVGLSLSMLALVLAHGFVETQLDLLQVWMVFGLVMGLAWWTRRSAEGAAQLRRPVGH